MSCVETLTDGSLMRSTEQRRRLSVITGQALLSRRTGLLISGSDFAGNPVITGMSVATVGTIEAYHSTRNGRLESVARFGRTATKLSDVISEVLKVTHKDIPPRSRTSLTELLHEGAVEFQGFFPLNDLFVLQALDTATKPYADSDFLRGMQAFTEAAMDHHGYTYKETILDPAYRFAQFLLAIEGRGSDLR